MNEGALLNDHDIRCIYGFVIEQAKCSVSFQRSVTCIKSVAHLTEVMMFVFTCW